MTTPRRLQTATGLLIAAGAIACGYSWAVGGKAPNRLGLEYLPLVPHLALVFAQAALLGTWAGLSRRSPWRRIAGLGLGIAALEAAIWAGEQHPEFTFAAAITAAGVEGGWVAARRWGIDLERGPGAESRAEGDGLRFSIRDLMLFTTAVAVLIGGAKALRTNVGHAGPSGLYVAIWAGIIAVLGLAAAGAALGPGRPAWRAASVVAAAATLGALLSYAVDPGDWKTYFYLITVTVLQSAIVLAVLLAARSCDYRLVRRATESRADAGKLVAEGVGP